MGSTAPLARPDVLIVNSFAPRRRSLSDVFLDNGTALLRAHLGQRGYVVAVEDPNTAGGFDRFGAPWLSRPLRRLSFTLMDSLSERPSRLTGGLFLALQGLLTRLQRRRARRYLNEIAARVAREKIPVVGVKAWYGDAFLWSKELAAAIRRASPETILVAGGPHANLYSHEGLILRHSGFDLAVYGEGEQALASILDAARAGRDRAERLALAARAGIAGLIWRDGGRVVVNAPRGGRAVEKDLPDYGGSVEGKALVHTIVDALGCDYNLCSFCAHKNIFGGYRRREPEAVVDEMEALTRRGVGLFRFAAGDTPLPHALAISRAIAARGLRVEFSLFHRAARSARRRFSELVNAYRRMLRAGLRGVFMGLETGDDATNCGELKKNVVVDDVVATLDALRRARELEGLPCALSLSTIHPVPSRSVPWETLRRRTLDAVLRARPDSALVSPPGVFPGTDWFEHAESYGFTLGPDYVQRLMEYEYELYKPTELWADAPYRLDGRGLREILAESARLRREIEEAGIPADLGDEDFLLVQASGEDPWTYRRQSLADILSCDYAYSRGLYAQLNAKSAALAGMNAINGRAARAV